MMSKYKYLLIDAMNLFYRNWFVGKRLDNGGAYLSLKNLLYYKFRYLAKGGKLIVCWDGKNKRRKHIYPNYKAKRQKMETKDLIEFRNQRRLLQKLLNLSGVRQCYNPDAEADDVMHTIAKKYNTEKRRVGIVSGDHDMYQSINYNVDLIKPIKNSELVLDRAQFIRTFELEPQYWVQVMSMCGCPTDNVPGIKGVGQKTALKIIYEIINKVKYKVKRSYLTDKMEKVLKEHVPTVEFTYALVKLSDHIETKIIKTKFKGKSLKREFANLRMVSFLKNNAVQKFKTLHTGK